MFCCTGAMFCCTGAMFCCRCLGVPGSREPPDLKVMGWVWGPVQGLCSAAQGLHSAADASECYVLVPGAPILDTHAPERDTFGTGGTHREARKAPMGPPGPAEGSLGGSRSDEQAQVRLVPPMYPSPQILPILPLEAAISY